MFELFCVLVVINTTGALNTNHSSGQGALLDQLSISQIHLKI